MALRVFFSAEGSESHLCFRLLIKQENVRKCVSI